MSVMTPSSVSPTPSATSVPASSARVPAPGIRRASTRIRTASPPRADTTPPAPAPATQAATTSRLRGRAAVIGAADDRVPAGAAGDLVGEVQEHTEHEPSRRHAGDGIDQAGEGTLHGAHHVGHP